MQSAEHLQSFFTSTAGAPALSHATFHPIFSSDQDKNEDEHPGVHGWRQKTSEFKGCLESGTCKLASFLPAKQAYSEAGRTTAFRSPCLSPSCLAVGTNQRESEVPFLTGLEVPQLGLAWEQTYSLAGRVRSQGRLQRRTGSEKAHCSPPS